MKRSFMRSRNDAKLCLAAGRIYGVRRIPASRQRRFEAANSRRFCDNAQNDSRFS